MGQMFSRQSQTAPKLIVPVHHLFKCTAMPLRMVVIFFHGIGLGKHNEWIETWTSQTTGGKFECWPKEWLPADLARENVSNVEILSLSYDSALLGANSDVTDIGKNLLQSLVANSGYKSFWNAPIVLVGYSFGGLVIKSLVVEVDKRAKQTQNNNPMDVEAQQMCKLFMSNLKGTIFYGVPHAGGEEAFKKYLAWQCKQIIAANITQIEQSQLLKNLKSFDRQMADLSVDFSLAVPESLNIYAFGEGLPVRQGEPVLVPFASAMQLSRNNNYKVEDATHLTICKPTSKEAINYILLKDFLVQIGEAVQRQTSQPFLEDKRVLSNPICQRHPSEEKEEASSSKSTPEIDFT